MTFDFCGLDASKCQKVQGETVGDFKPTLKTGLSSAEAEHAKVAARRAGTATLRMIGTRRTKRKEDRRRGGGRK